MIDTETIEGGEFSSFPRLQLEPAVGVEAMLENMRSALARPLPSVRACRPHGLEMSVAAGGPSLTDTYGSLAGYIVAVNGTLRWLLERDVTPNACGVVDPGRHMTGIVEADPRVTYFVASVCDPSLFDKLLRAGCHVVLWHPSGALECEIVLANAKPDDWLMVGGGCTMGLRWINLGYLCGFRAFHLHGLDSSFRNGKTHAYPDRADSKDSLVVSGRRTRLNFVSQVQDFFEVLSTYARDEFDPISVSVYGEGLLQDELANRLRERRELLGKRSSICYVAPGEHSQAPHVAS